MSIELVARGSARPLTACRRYQLAEAVCPGGRPSQAFLRALRRFDKELELYWHPIRQRWLLYRVARRKPVPSDDFLVKELEIAGPRGEYRLPGWWLLDYLRRADKTQGGTIDPGYADRQYVKQIRQEQLEEAKAHDQAADEIAADYTANLIRYGWGQPHSVHVNRT